MDKANNATFYANRHNLEDLHEDYTTDIEGILGIQAFKFQNLGDIEQREIMAKLAEAETYCENNKTKQKIHSKRVEFLSMLAKDTMHDTKDIERFLHSKHLSKEKRNNQ